MRFLKVPYLAVAILAWPSVTVAIEPAESRKILAAAKASGADIEDGSQRATFFCKIALAEQRMGAEASAKTTIGAAISAAALLGGDARDLSLGGIAVAQARLGLLADARRSIREIRRPPLRWEASSETAQSLADTGDSKGARAFVDAIDEESFKNLALLELGEAQAKRGDKSAVQTIMSINDPTMQSLAQSTVAIRLASAQELSLAADLAQRIAEPLAKARALEAIAVAQRDASAARAALAEAVELARKSDRASRFRFLAAALARMGDYKSAISAAECCDGIAEQSAAFADVASLQAERGDVSGASAIVERIDEVATKGIALENIAARQAVDGNIEDAFRTAGAIGDPYRKGSALGRIAAARAAACDRPTVRRALSLAIEATAATDPGGGVEVIAMRELGQLAAKLGDEDFAHKAFNAAREAVAAYDDDAYQSQLLAEIGRAEAASGFVQAGIAAASELRSSQSKAWSLLGTAEGIIAARDARTKQSQPND